MIEGKKIFVTGGAGFIGATVIGRLIDQNEVVVFDNFQRDSLKYQPFSKHENLRVINGDVMDYDGVATAIEGANLVVHCAGIAGIDTVIKQPTKTLSVNIIGTYNVLEAAKSLMNLERVVCFSTSEVFGSNALSSKETDQTVIGAVGAARWSYAVSKLAEEHLSIAYHNEFALPATVVRPFNVYGPGQVGAGALKIFVQRAIKNEPITIHGDGTQIRAWCYVDDMVDGTLLTMATPDAVGESFNIGNKRSVETIYGLANTVVRILDSESEITLGPALGQDIELRIPNVEKAKALLGFEAKVDLEEGIRRTAKFYRQNP